MINSTGTAWMLVIVCGVASGQPQIPSEFETPGASLTRLFALGGVDSFSVSQSSDEVFAGGSFRLDIGFNDAGVFQFSSVGLGAQNAGEAEFLTDPAADTFSITVRAPEPAVGGLELFVILRDDDNNDGTIDAASDDDEWASTAIPLTPGRALYNVALVEFEDLNPGTGNDVRDFANGPTGAMVLTFQTSTTLPGGRIEIPISVWIDHAGVYVGEQGLPASCLADANGDGVATPADFGAWIAAFNSMSPACDQNGDGTCTPADFGAWITNFNSGC